MALCKSTVLKVYNAVIEDVILGVRDVFSDEGLDEQVLQELKTLWETKLMASKAVESSTDNPDHKPGIMKKAEVVTNGAVFNNHMNNKQPIKQVVNNHIIGHQTANSSHVVSNHLVTSSLVASVQSSSEDKMIPIQITLPAQPTLDSVTRVLTIHVPTSALNGPQLHTLLTGPVITATMGLPAALASSLLQQHVNAALQQQQQHAAQQHAAQQQQTSTTMMAQQKVVLQQIDGVADVLHVRPSVPRDEPKLPQRPRQLTLELVGGGLDGTTDTSDEEEDGTEEEGTEDEGEDEKEDDDPDGMDDATNEEEPLNSEDDVTDEEPADLFDTDNVVVCQYDKITRSRNKWKFYLKDGIMNLEGEDFVFQKANGDAEW